VTIGSLPPCKTRCRVTSANLALEADGGSFWLVVNLFSATERRLHVVADILRSYHFFKLCLMDEAGVLLVYAAQNQGSVAGVLLSGKQPASIALRQAASFVTMLHWMNRTKMN